MSAVTPPTIRQPGEDRGMPSVSSSIALLVAGAGRQIQELFEAELASAGMSMSFLGVLGHLSRNPDLSVSDLARRAGVTAQSMHTTVRSLEVAGLARTVRHGQGRRSQISVTEEGRAALGRAGLAAAELDKTVLAQLSDAEREELKNLLMKAGAHVPPASQGIDRQRRVESVST